MMQFILAGVIGVGLFVIGLMLFLKGMAYKFKDDDNFKLR